MWWQKTAQEIREKQTEAETVRIYVTDSILQNS